uniref:E2 n=1 Tax=Lactococcus phage c6A TaxID=206060 RepID=Q7Y4E9_9CAUD|nr:E2 [Lactococcus phage c6A]
MLFRLLYLRFGKSIKRRILIDNFSNFCYYNFIGYFYS